jgi:hypothetical protein
VSTLAQLDDRLKRIEQLLTKITPILNTNTKKAGSKIISDSGVENLKQKRTFTDVVDEESSGQDSDEEDDEDNEEDDNDDDDHDFSGEESVDDQFMAVCNQSLTPEQSSPAAVLLKFEEKKHSHKKLDIPSKFVKNTIKSNTKQMESPPLKRSKSAKQLATSINDQRSSDHVLSSKDHRLCLDVPSVPNTTTLVGLATSLSEINQTNPDIISATLLKTSENQCFSDTPFFFCTSTGLKWIADKTGDSNLTPRFEKAFKSAHMAQFSQFRSSIEQCDEPYQLSSEMLIECAESFKSEISFIGFMETHEIDMLVESELHPNPAEGKVNGFAEKIAIYCIVALGLITINEHDDDEVKKMAYKADLGMIRRQINSAFYYFFRFALIGNSLMGIKSLTLLSICMLFSVCHPPALAVLAVAVRLAQEVGLHTKRYTQNMPRVEAERNRRLWWTLYCLEKDITIMHSKPSTIIDDSISTPLPQYTPEIDLSCESEAFCFMQKTAELYLLWARVCSTIEKIQTLRLKEKEKMQRLIQFDKELLAWSESVPSHSQPGCLNECDSFFSKVRLKERLKFQFYHTITHSVYFFIQIAVHRQVAYHPSWVYKVLRPTDPMSPSSDAEATPNSHSVISRIVASKTFNNTLDPAQATEKVHRSIVERYNNVKLVPKKIAADYPRFLRSFQLSVEYSRATIDSMCHDDGSSKYFSLSFFLLNAFITLLIKCLMQPKDIDTPNDLVKMEYVISWFKKLSFFTSEIMPPDQDNFLSVLAESVANYVDRIRGVKRNSSSASDALAPKIFISGEDHDHNNNASASNKSNNNTTNSNTLQEPSQDMGTPASVSSPSLSSILNSTNVNPIGSTSSTPNNGKLYNQSVFDDQTNNFGLSNNDRPAGLPDVFSEFENGSSNTDTSGMSGALHEDILSRILNSSGINFANENIGSNTSANSTFGNVSANGALGTDTSSINQTTANNNGANTAPGVTIGDNNLLLATANEDSYDNYMMELDMTMNDFKIFDSLYQLSSYLSTGEGSEIV